MVTQQEIDRHNDVTRTIIIGTICERMGMCSPRDVIDAANDIMDMLKRRGYEPQILSLNQLKDGTRV